MSKKTYALVLGIVGGVATIAAAVVTFFNPTYCAAIVAAIGIVDTAVNEVCALFINKS